MFYKSESTVQSAELWEKVFGSQTIELTCVRVVQWVLEMCTVTMEATVGHKVREQRQRLNRTDDRKTEII